MEFIAKYNEMLFSGTALNVTQQLHYDQLKTDEKEEREKERQEREKEKEREEREKDRQLELDIAKLHINGKAGDD